MKSFSSSLFLSGLLMMSAGIMRASIIESITLDLSALHAGSTLSGTFALSNSPMAGDSASAQLFFSDPADYSASPLTATIMIGSGTFLAYTVGFSDIVFTNPSGNMFTKNVDLMPSGMAQCAAFPCTSTGRFQDGFPAAFTANYIITPVAAAVPEPAYGAPLIPVLLLCLIVRNRVVLATRQRLSVTA